MQAAIPNSGSTIQSTCIQRGGGGDTSPGSGHDRGWQNRGASPTVACTYVLALVCVYCIARNIGGDLILVNWQFYINHQIKFLPKLKFNPLATTLR